MSPSEFFSREEVLSGFTARRAQTLLFLIESRTAHRVAQSQQAMNLFLTPEAEGQRDLAFLEAFALGREPPLRPTIQDLERHAPEWGSLVPDNPELRAAVAHLLGSKFAFTSRDVPQLRAALDLGGAAVQHAYARRYGQSLETIYQRQAKWGERLRWAGAAFANRLESLPPFWTVYALTLTETVGGGILAMPIALAKVGPLPGIALLIVLGLANVLTIAQMAEAVARTGSIRYGNAFFGRLVSEYLGGAGSLVLMLSLAAFSMAALLGYYIGVSSALSTVAPVRPEIWMALLFLAGLYFLSRGSLSSTITLSLVVGAVNIVMVLILALLACSRLQLKNLTYFNVPVLNGRPFDPTILQLIFGVILLAYFGHSSVGNCGKLVLQRDPSARSLIWGTVAAQLTAIVLYCFWLVGVNGAIPPQTLASEKGTALAPLAATVGPVVNVFGLVLVVLGMGMASIHMSLGLFNLVRERLPETSQPVLLLTREQSTLYMYPHRSRETPRLALTYVGLAGGAPEFALYRQMDGSRDRQKVAVADHWEDAELETQLDVLDASADHVRVRIRSALAVTVEEQPEAVGLDLLDLLLAPGVESDLVRWLLQHGAANLDEVADYLQKDPATARAQLSTLVENGLVHEDHTHGQTLYRARLAPRRRRELPDQIWQALDVAAPRARGRLRGESRLLLPAREVVSNPRSRFWLATSPVLLILLIGEGLVLTNNQSFTWVLNLGGVLAAPIFAGIFPVLLLASSRRKGDIVPPWFYRFVGHPVVLVTLSGVFLSSLLAHGLFIWQGVPERAAALLAGLIVVGMTILVIRRGALRPRAVVEIRQGAHDRADFAVIVGGAFAPAEVRFQYGDREERLRASSGEVTDISSLRAASFEIDTPAPELEVWAHRITPQGTSTRLPARLTVSSIPELGGPAGIADSSATAAMRVYCAELGLTAGPILVPLNSARHRIQLAFDEGR